MKHWYRNAVPAYPHPQFDVYSWEYTQITPAETDHLIDQLQHGAGVDPIACTKRWVEPPDYVRFSGEMSKAELAQLERAEERARKAYRREMQAETRADVAERDAQIKLNWDRLYAQFNREGWD